MYRCGFKLCVPQSKGPYALLRYATKADKRKGIDRKVGPKIDSTADSLAAKGFLRPQKEYRPPSNSASMVEDILKKHLDLVHNSQSLQDVAVKFKVFDECFRAFQHSVPNSMLHSIETVADLKNFYSTPVSKLTPYDNLKNTDLPPNLHVQYEYHRFHPETDRMFDGITAFPESSTIVSGLKYKNKYKQLEQKPRDWLYSE